MTHKANYAKAGAALGADLVGNPDLAMVPSIAARIIVRGSVEGWFTGRRLSDYLPGDYIGARAVINGKDKAAQIAAYARAFEAALAAIEATPTPVDASPAPDPVAKPALDDYPGFWAAIIAIVASFFRGAK